LLSPNVYKYPPSFFESCGFAFANHVGQQVAVPVCYFGVLSSPPPATIDFHVNNGTKIAITLDPLTFILSPVVGGEERVRGM
jgi:hypothetical protein